MARTKNARNAEYTKEYNRKMFLRMVRTMPMSRAEVARRMGLTRAATSLIADDLLQQGMVEETMAKAAFRGRTPTPLAPKADAVYAVGVYLNRDGCTVGLVDFCSKVVAKRKLRIDDSSKGQLEPLLDAIYQVIEESNVPWEKVVGVGVSAPGPLDGETGVILNPPRFDLWHNTALGAIMGEKLNIPIYLENNASCLARYNQGKPEAMGSEDFLLLLVDSGIGSGVISNGKVLKGIHYFTSELGHIAIDYNGEKCLCGNRGCLESYASMPNLLKGSPFSNWQEVMDCIETDSQAQRLADREAEYLSTGIATLTNIISIDTVLMSGDLLYGADKFAPILEEKINSKTMRRDMIPLHVYPACTGPDVRIKAAADVAFGRFLTL